MTPDLLTLTTEAGQTIQISLDTDTGYHTKSDATSTEIAVGSTVEVEIASEVDPASRMRASMRRPFSARPPT